MVELTSLVLLEAVKAEAELVTIGPMESGGRVRFQVMTASEDPDDQILLLAAGADDYIKKPIDPPLAVNRVQAVLRRASRERSLITA